MCGSDTLTFGQHRKKEFFKKLVVSMFVGISKRGSTDRLDAKVIEMAGLRGKAGFNSAEAVLSGKLAEKHRGEMVPGAEASGVMFGFGL